MIPAGAQGWCAKAFFSRERQEANSGLRGKENKELRSFESDLGQKGGQLSVLEFG